MADKLLTVERSEFIFQWVFSFVFSISFGPFSVILFYKLKNESKIVLHNFHIYSFKFHLSKTFFYQSNFNRNCDFQTDCQQALLGRRFARSSLRRKMRPSWRCEAVRKGSLTATAEQSLMEGDVGCLPSSGARRSAVSQSGHCA